MVFNSLTTFVGTLRGKAASRPLIRCSGCRKTLVKSLADFCKRPVANPVEETRFSCSETREKGDLSWSIINQLVGLAGWRVFLQPP